MDDRHTSPYIPDGAEADENDWLDSQRPGAPKPKAPRKKPNGRSRIDPEAGAAAPLAIINPTQWQGIEVPSREWIVQDWLPVGTVSANYGDGGAGKSILAQELMTSCATTEPWLGYAVSQCRSIGLFCEDDENELHRRQDKINDALGVHFADLEHMRLVSGYGHDNTLVAFTPDGELQIRPRFHQIAEAAKAFGAHLVVLDTAADLFSGNENDRRQVRVFISLLGRLALDLNGAVLLNAHPSRSGLKSGDLDGGSTAWSNSVRSRWSLAPPEAEKDDDTAPDTSLRVLTRRKANYAATGSTIRLRWRNGVLLPMTSDGRAVAGPISQQTVDELFLTLLDRCSAQNFNVSSSKSSGNYAPKVFARRPDRDGCNRRDFETAMMRLFTARQLINEEYGRTGDPHYRVARAT